MTDDRVSVRPMREEHLVLVDAWLREPHVAKWWLDGSAVETEIDEIRRRLRGEADTDTRMLTVYAGERPIGWAQWYWWDDYPADAAAVGTDPGEAGMDYAIGVPQLIGRGLGTQMIAAVAREIRRHGAGAPIVVDPDERNHASRRVLEHNGFQLVGIREVPGQPVDYRGAIYRLARERVWLAGVEDAPTVARMLDQFNREFDEPSPGPQVLAGRLAKLLARGDDVDVLLGGSGPDGVAVLRFRPSIWTEGAECYLAELYVTPARRDLGLGRAIMEEAMAHARRRGADYLSIGVDEPDAGARHLYESLGFSNRTGGPEGPLMFVYEREL